MTPCTPTPLDHPTFPSWPVHLPRSLATLLDLPAGEGHCLLLFPNLGFPPAVPFPVRPICPESSTRSPGGTFRASIVVPPPASPFHPGSLLHRCFRSPITTVHSGIRPPDAWCFYCSRLWALSAILSFMSFRWLPPSPAAVPTGKASRPAPLHTFSSPRGVSTLSRQGGMKQWRNYTRCTNGGWIFR